MASGRPLSQPWQQYNFIRSQWWNCIIVGPMENLLHLITSLSVQWTELTGHISSDRPFTVHVFCIETCEIEGLFHTFAVKLIPWTSHYSDSELYRIINGDTVLIISKTPENTRQAIARASGVVDAYRGRYFLVHYSYFDQKVIESLARFAWERQLTQVVIVRLEDTAMYAVVPKCQEPRVIQVSAVRWPDLKNLQFCNCILKMAANNVPPYVIFDGANDSTIAGSFGPFYRYVKAALKFQVLLIPTSYANVTEKVIAGEVDLFFTPRLVAPNVPLESFPIRATDLEWCVPNGCVFPDTTYFLWREFTWVTWMLLAACVFAVTLTIWCLTPSNTITFVDSLFAILATLASTVAKLPGGNMRVVLVGWLLPMMVLSTAYQTVLHSMMTAPLILHEIEDIHGLLKSHIPLICTTSTCPPLRILARDDAVSAELAARAEEMDPTAATRLILSHQETHALFASDYICNVHCTRMRALEGDGEGYRQYLGVFGVLRSSWLAPAFRQLALRSQASGLWSKWIQNKVRKPGCSSAENRDSQPITVALLWPAILLWCCGLFVGLIVFVTELWWHWRKEKMSETALLHGDDIIIEVQKELRQKLKQFDNPRNLVGPNFTGAWH